MTIEEFVIVEDNVKTELNNELDLADIRIENAGNVWIRVNVLSYDENVRLINKTCKNIQETK